jgi:diguanylate cyclase (GGDEF) domain
MLCLFTGMAIISVFITADWLKDRTNVEQFFWAMAFWSAAAGVLLGAFRNILPDWLALGIGNGLTVLSIPLFWIGMRIFDGREVNRLWALMPPASWLVLYFCVPPFTIDINARIIVLSVLVGGMSILVAVEAWRGRAREPLPARTWLSVSFAGHAFIYVLRIPFAILEPVRTVGGVPVSLPNSIFLFCLFALALMAGFSLFILTRERVELRYRREAQIDSLTGLFNRRAFIETVEHIRGQGKGAGALALLDLDHFKRINDTYGHGGGDEALKAFSALVGERLTSDMVFGRIGGEEFALYIPEIDLERARAVCEDVRSAVEQAVIPLGEQQLRMTVSIGLSADVASYADINFLLGIADRGLYISKRNGRNRVTALNASAGLKLIASLMADNGGARRGNRDLKKTT